MKKRATKGKPALKDLKARTAGEVKGGYGAVEHSSEATNLVPQVKTGWDLKPNAKHG